MILEIGYINIKLYFSLFNKENSVIGDSRIYNIIYMITKDQLSKLIYSIYIDKLKVNLFYCSCT